MTSDDDRPRSTWRSYLGPVVLTSRRRRGTLALLAVWSAATVVLLAAGRLDIVWLPVVGMVTASTLLLRDRAGRRRST
jgi:O-antigen ligase